MTKQTKQTKELKYNCISKNVVSEIANIYKDYRVAEHIQDLYNLIQYQIQEIHQKRSEQIAFKHQIAWEQYNQPEQSGIIT